jgi:hypothetical protein
MALLKNDLPPGFICQLSPVVHWVQFEEIFFGGTTQESHRKQSTSLFGIGMKRECC